MSITDELREWAKTLTHWWYDPVKDEYTYTTGTMLPSIDAVRLDSNITAIADRIDAEHQKAEDEWRAKNGNMWLKGYAACHEELMEGHPVIAADLEKAGWVRLPVDADGVTIRVGDVMNSKVDHLFDGRPFEVRALVLCEDGWEVADGRFGNRYEPDSLRHHHAPTVEDVLREMAGRCYADEDEPRDRDAIVAEYAAKLRLAEVEDA